MPLDPQIETLLQRVAAEGGPAPETLTVAQNRAFGRAFGALAGAPVPVADVRDTAAAADGRTVPVRLYRPVTEPNAGPLPVTLFLHGGGWVFGDLDTQDNIARTVAVRSRTIVVSVDYRLAPEHRFPAAVDDAYAALTWVADSAAGFGGDGKRIAVFGESAGGNLAAVLAQESLRRGGPRITLQVLAYPAVDRFDDSPSMYENMAGPVLSRSYLEWFWGAYLSTPDQGADPRVSPARSDELAGLAPAVIATAENDPLRDQGDHYARKLAGAGVPVQHLPIEGAVHGFLSFTGSVQLSRDVLNRLADAVATAFHRPGPRDAVSRRTPAARGQDSDHHRAEKPYLNRPRNIQAEQVPHPGDLPATGTRRQDPPAARRCEPNRAAPEDPALSD